MLMNCIVRSEQSEGWCHFMNKKYEGDVSHGWVLALAREILPVSLSVNLSLWYYEQIKRFITVDSFIFVSASISVV